MEEPFGVGFVGEGDLKMIMSAPGVIHGTGGEESPGKIGGLLLARLQGERGQMTLEEFNAKVIKDILGFSFHEDMKKDALKETSPACISEPGFDAIEIVKTAINAFSDGRGFTHELKGGTLARLMETPVDFHERRKEGTFFLIGSGEPGAIPL